MFMSGVAAEELVGLGAHLPREWRRGDETRARKITKRGLHADVQDARLLLRRHWDAVRALAYRLMQEQRVEGQEAEQLIVEHLDANTRLRLRGRAA